MSHRCPPIITLGDPIGSRTDVDEILWHVREVSGFVEETIAWGDHAERQFWRAVLEGVMYGPHYANHVPA